MRYENYYWGMHFMWWMVWAYLLFWIFVVPYDIPGQRSRRDSSFDILRKRYAAGEISEDQYHMMKVILEDDNVKRS